MAYASNKCILMLLSVAIALAVFAPSCDAFHLPKLHTRAFARAMQAKSGGAPARQLMECMGGEYLRVNCTGTADGTVTEVLYKIFDNDMCSGTPNMDFGIAPSAFTSLTGGTLNMDGCQPITDSEMHGIITCNAGELGMQMFSDAMCTTLVVNMESITTSITNAANCNCNDDDDDDDDGDAGCSDACPSFPQSCEELSTLMARPGGCAATCGAADVASIRQEFVIAHMMDQGPDLLNCTAAFEELGNRASIIPTTAPTSTPTTSNSAPTRFWHLAPALLALVPLVFVLAW